MSIENPFRYGIVVDEPYFIDREKEMAEISLDMVSGNNLIIASPILEMDSGHTPCCEH